MKQKGRATQRCLGVSLAVVLGSLALFLCGCGHAERASPTTAKALALPPLNVHEVWTAFRKSYPYPIQTVAVQNGANGDHVIIISEPPPHVTKADLTALLPGVIFYRHRIGDDGFVTDAVARVQGSEQSIQGLIADLHRVLYFTAYKASALQLPTPSVFDRPRPKLDVSIASDDLQTWILSTTSTPVMFQPLIGGGDVRFSEIRESSSLVYLSNPAGLVGWWIPKAVHLSDCGVQAREFAVESDLVLGAIGNGRGVLILARERLAPPELLPPLRFETMVRLCGIDSDELMQTIDPQLLSCYISEKPRERWELNLLSPELHDSELGTLLTLADVLLKSWSVNGLNAVRGFRDYPQSAAWPFEPLLTDRLDADGLVFNYNSFTAGRTVALGNGIISYSVTRTGVLPITYLPVNLAEPANAGGVKKVAAVHEAEKIAYDWFAKRQDPHLVRVVQYTALLQILNAFGVACDQEPADDALVEETRARLTREMLNRLRGPDRAAVLRRVTDSPHQHVLNEINDEAIKDPKLDELKKIVGDDAWKTVRAKLTDLSAMVGEVADLDEKAFKGIAEAIADGDEEFEDDFPLYALALQALASAERLDLQLKAKLAGQATGWIHTPAIIYDENRGAIALGEGGHNLAVKPPAVVVDATLPPGTIRHVEGEVRVHPDSLRNVVVEGPGQEAKLLPRPPPESMSVVLGRSELPVASPRTRFKGWPPADRDLPTAHLRVVAEIRKSRPNAVYILDNKDGTFLIDTPRAKLMARSHREAIDIALDTCPERHVDVQLAGMSADQADAFGLSMFARRKSGARTVSTLVEHEVPRVGLPRTFTPRQYDVHGVTINTFHVTDGHGHGEFVAPSMIANEPALKGDVSFTAVESASLKLKESQRPFEVALKEALQEAETPADFHQRFEEDFREQMEKAFPGTDFSRLKVNTKFFFQTQDQYFSEGADGDRERRALG